MILKKFILFLFILISTTTTNNFVFATNTSTEQIERDLQNVLKKITTFETLLDKKDDSYHENRKNLSELQKIYYDIQNRLLNLEYPNEYIPEASYYVNGENSLDCYSETFGDLIFYSFDGKNLKNIKYFYSPLSGDKRLDPNAPKPQPSSFELKYNDCIFSYLIDFNFCGHRFKHLPMRKGIPGWWIIFYDKNRNKIAHHRYDIEKNEIRVLSPSKKEYDHTYKIVCYAFDPQNPQSVDKNFHLDLRIAKDITLYKTALRGL